MNEAGVPCGPILNMQETMEDPQVEHLRMAESVQHPKLGDVRLVGQAIKLSRSALPAFHAAPESGEHNADVYGDLGLTSEQMAELQREGII